MSKSLPILAFDRASVRSYDDNGHMHVETSPVTKATVNPYYGREIPNSAALGLDLNKVYYLLRDPLELERAVSTFANLPILIKHQPTFADNYASELVMGSTGSNVVWDAPYIKVDLAFWSEKAIAGIESKEQTELSSSYHYDADMTPGEYEGMRYDGVMRNIRGNHVALVDVGRAGSDVVVQDRNPFIEGNPMTKQQKLAQARAQAKLAKERKLKLAQDKAKADIKAKLAADGKPEDIDAIINKLAQDAAEAEEEQEAAEKKAAEDAEDEDDLEDDPDNPGQKRKKQPPAKDADPADPKPPEGDDDKPTKAAMDAAIKLAEDRATTNAVQRVEALYKAREAVKPLVGTVALDSADQVYKFALDQSGIDTKGVHATAYPAMVNMLLTQQSKPTSGGHVAMDAQSIQQVNTKIPGLGRFKQA